MGRLDQFADITGSMNQVDTNAQNIQQIIDEMNRNSDQLDAISNGLSIIGRNTLIGTWNGTGGAGGSLTLQQNHGFQTAPIFMASFLRSDVPGVYYPVPQWFYDGSGSFQARTYSYTDATNIYFSFTSASNGSPITFTFSYYILQQPAQVPTGA